jgi:hypothetical protein
VSDRWQDDPERAARITPLLADVERRRAALDQAQTAAAEEDVPRHEVAERAARVRGAGAGLSAAVSTAFFDRSAPPDEDIAAAAGWTVAEVAELRNRLNAPPAD